MLSCHLATLFLACYLTLETTRSGDQVTGLPMLSFVHQAQAFPAKRPAQERRNDFDEISTDLLAAKAADCLLYTSRCV